jgi:hypothetical protein
VTRKRTLHFGVVAVLAIGPIVSGCNRFRTLEECNDLAHAVNPTLSKIAALRQARPATNEQYARIATLYASLSEALGRTRLRNPALVALATEYQQLYETASASARSYADAVRDKDTKRSSAVLAAARQQARRERMLSRRFVAACGNH